MTVTAIVATATVVIVASSLVVVVGLSLSSSFCVRIFFANEHLVIRHSPATIVQGSSTEHTGQRSCKRSKLGFRDRNTAGREW